MSDIIGRIHSYETCGTVDGPGIRFVVFMQGCPLRCQYCHNPDTWNMSDGSTHTPQDVYNEMVKYKSYMKFSNGGITVTGGEPLLQAQFVTELFKLCKADGIHTAIDTSGFIFNDQVKSLLDLTDLVLLDVKHFDPEQYKIVTGAALKPTLDFLDYLGKINKPAWIRYVLVPGLTDQLPSIEALAKHLGQYKNIEKIEVLPFHKMGEYKWKTLNLDYKLSDVNEPTQELREEVIKTFKMYNLNVATV